MKVFLHTRSAGTMEWQQSDVECAQIPHVGEYVALATDAPYYFRVQLVVHTPFPVECDAEVYAVEVDHTDAKQQAFASEAGEAGEAGEEGMEPPPWPPHAERFTHP